jgi:hypothetical protein
VSFLFECLSLCLSEYCVWVLPSLYPALYYLRPSSPAPSHHVRPSVPSCSSVLLCCYCSRGWRLLWVVVFPALPYPVAHRSLCRHVRSLRLHEVRLELFNLEWDNAELVLVRMGIGSREWDQYQANNAWVSCFIKAPAAPPAACSLPRNAVEGRYCRIVELRAHRRRLGAPPVCE